MPEPRTANAFLPSSNLQFNQSDAQPAFCFRFANGQQHAFFCIKEVNKHRFNKEKILHWHPGSIGESWNQIREQIVHTTKPFSQLKVSRVSIPGFWTYSTEEAVEHDKVVVVVQEEHPPKEIAWDFSLSRLPMK